MKRISIIITAFSLSFLSACGQHYRYPCQNPENWETEACKRPLCEVNRDCPDHIFWEEESQSRPVLPGSGNSKTTCDRE